MRPTTSHTRISAVRTDALFASSLQRSDEPGGGQVQQAIAAAIRQFGRRGCAERVAQEFGDHPEIAVTRMRWARRAVGEAFAAPAPAAARARPARPGRRRATVHAGRSAASAGRAA